MTTNFEAKIYEMLIGSCKATFCPGTKSLKSEDGNSKSSLEDGKVLYTWYSVVEEKWINAVSNSCFLTPQLLGSVCCTQTFLMICSFLRNITGLNKSEPSIMKNIFRNGVGSVKIAYSSHQKTQDWICALAPNSCFLQTIIMVQVIELLPSIL